MLVIDRMTQFTPLQKPAAAGKPGQPTDTVQQQRPDSQYCRQTASTAGRQTDRQADRHLLTFSTWQSQSQERGRQQGRHTQSPSGPVTGEPRRRFRYYVRVSLRRWQPENGRLGVNYAKKMFQRKDKYKWWRPEDRQETGILKSIQFKSNNHPRRPEASNLPSALLAWFVGMNLSTTV